MLVTRLLFFSCLPALNIPHDPNNMYVYTINFLETGVFLSKLDIHLIILVITLDSEIDVGPTFISFECFSRPYGLIREYIEVI